jgi:hypothetical protein
MSIGIASFPLDAASAIELFENADSAMYRAKEIGKNRSVIYDPAVDANKLNFRKRHRPSEYVDNRLKPAVPNPPILDENMVIPCNNNAVEPELLISSEKEFNVAASFIYPAPSHDVEVILNKDFQTEELK